MAVATYEDSVLLLKERAGAMGDALPLVQRVPRPDDDPIGPSFFGPRWEVVVLAVLSLPGLYVSRSQLARISFRSSDLRLAAFNWSDVLDCDFHGADLSGAALRSSRFTRCT